MEIEKKKIVYHAFLHRLRAVRKREISLPVGSETDRGGNLGLGRL